MSKIKKIYQTIKKRRMTGLVGDIQKINKKYYIIVRFVFCLSFVGKSSMNSLKGYLRQTTCIDKNIWTIPKTFKSVRFYMEKKLKSHAIHEFLDGYSGALIFSSHLRCLGASPADLATWPWVIVTPLLTLHSVKHHQVYLKLWPNS